VGPKSYIPPGNDRPILQTTNERQKPMKPRDSRFRFCDPSFYSLIVLLSGVATISLGQTPAPAPQAESQEMTTTTPEAPKIPNDQLDSLVAPIALYPDALLSQTLVASTYPLEIIQLEQWMKKNKDLKGKALADAVEKQKWDPSIQAMALFPDVVKQLAENVSWTTDLGNAFLAQQSDVMDAVQRMRVKAQGAGNLKSSQQQKVESKTVESKNVIVIEQADPQVVYVPAYNPTVVYGAPPTYPYPSMYYPPGYGALAFGAGVAIGAAWGGGGWGYGCGWGHGDVNINYNNKYVNHYNKTNVNKGQQGGQGNKWQHQPQHRGSAPYGDRNTANKFGGGARQQPAGAAANRPGGGGSGTANRPGGGAGNRPGGGGAGVATRPSGGAGAARPGGGGTGTRPGAGASTRPAGGGGGGDRIGGRSVSSGSSYGSRGGGDAFGGGGGRGGGDFARASSNRGGHSMGGGGFSRGGGGGGRGGGGRGGGGGRR
jgi:hypothetical protein